MSADMFNVSALSCLGLILTLLISDTLCLANDAARNDAEQDIVLDGQQAADR